MVPAQKYSNEEKRNSLDQEEETTKWTQLIYNKEEGTFLGRNTESWGKIFKNCTKNFEVKFNDDDSKSA